MKDKTSQGRQGSLSFQFGKKSKALRGKTTAADAGSTLGVGGEGSLRVPKLRKQSKSPRPAVALGQIEKAKGKRYSSPQPAGQPRAGRSSSKKAKMDARGAGPPRRSLTKQSKMHNQDGSLGTVAENTREYTGERQDRTAMAERQLEFD